MASRLEDYLLSVIAEGEAQKKGPVASLLRVALGGAAAAYDVGLEAYLAAEKIGLRRRVKLPIPTVSIGNLTVGGTGKTPMTQWLCRQFQARGLRPAILSRGHGGDSQAARIVSDAEGHVQLTATQAGDEPFLLAETLPGVPVLVGKDRRQTGRAALRHFGLDVLVLDDGFQYWQLAKDLDIVLLDAARPFDNGFPLPRGLLREPKRHLRRAKIVIATRADRINMDERERLAAEVKRLATEAALFFARHCADELVPLSEHCLPVPLSALRGADVLALSGVAQPRSFAALLTEAGATITRHLVYNDHYAYGLADAETARAAAQESGATMIVMTEKDATKWPRAEMPVPVYALRVMVDVERADECVHAILERLSLTL